MSVPGLVVRPARDEDAAALIRLLRRTWLTTWAPELPFEAVQRFAADDPTAPYIRSMWPEMRVGLVGGALLGMVHPCSGRIGALHVDPVVQGRGIGSTLLAAAEAEIAAAHPVAQLEVLAFNGTARRFYAARGWRETGRHAGEECGAPVEVIVLRKALQPRAT